MTTEHIEDGAQQHVQLLAVLLCWQVAAVRATSGQCAVTYAKRNGWGLEAEGAHAAMAAAAVVMLAGAPSSGSSWCNWMR